MAYDQSVSSVDGKDYFGVNNPKPKSELNMETFLKLLTVQLSHQNPMEPMNDRDFFAQMAQLGQVDGMNKLNNAMSVTQANQLIGKEVTAVRPYTDEGSGGVSSIVTGIASRLTVKEGKYLLGIREPNGGIVDVTLNNIQQVNEASSSSTSTQVATDYANAGLLVGKTVVVKHPTQIDSLGQPKVIEMKVDRIAIESGTIRIVGKDSSGGDLRYMLTEILDVKA